MEYANGNIRLIHGDCMDFMRTLPDNAFDLAVVDPPYGDGNFQTPPHKRAMSRDGGGGSTGTNEPSQLRALTGRFGKYKRLNYPPPKAKMRQAKRKVFGGMLLRVRSISRNCLESQRIRLFGAATTSIYHLVGASLFGANCQYQRLSAWRCVNMLGLLSTPTQNGSSVLRKAKRETHGFILRKNRLLSTPGY